MILNENNHPPKDGINEFTFENLDVGDISSIEIGSRNQEEEWLVKMIEVTLPLKEG